MCIKMSINLQFISLKEANTQSWLKADTNAT